MFVIVDEQPIQEPCQNCGSMPVYRRRQNTAYVNDELNFAIFCEECHVINDEYWVDMWADHNQGRL